MITRRFLKSHLQSSRSLKNNKKRQSAPRSLPNLRPSARILHWVCTMQMRQFNYEACLNYREIDNSPPSKSQIAAPSTSGSGNRHMVHVEHQRSHANLSLSVQILPWGAQTRNESNCIASSDSLSAKSVPGPPSDLGVLNALLIRWQVLLSRNKGDNKHRVRIDSHPANNRVYA